MGDRAVGRLLDRAHTLSGGIRHLLCWWSFDFCAVLLGSLVARMLLLPAAAVGRRLGVGIVGNSRLMMPD